METNLQYREWISSNVQIVQLSKSEGSILLTPAELKIPEK